MMVENPSIEHGSSEIINAVHREQREKILRKLDQLPPERSRTVREWMAIIGEALDSSDEGMSGESASPCGVRRPRRPGRAQGTDGRGAGAQCTTTG